MIKLPFNARGRLLAVSGPAAGRRFGNGPNGLLPLGHPRRSSRALLPSVVPQAAIPAIQDSADDDEDLPVIPGAFSDVFEEASKPAPPTYVPPESHSLTIPFGSRSLTLETGEIGRQANGAIFAREGDSVVYTTVCCGEATGDGSFAPFQVHYQERFSSVGRTLGGYLKRDGRPKDQEVLKSRLLDRPLRPSLQDGWQFETQVLSWVLSFDGVTGPEPLAITAAGAALAVSDVPIKNVVAGARVGFIEGEFVVNPTAQQMKSSKLDLVVAGTKEAILMIEGYGDFLTEEQMLEAVGKGHDMIKGVCASIESWALQIGKAKRTDGYRPPEGLEAKVKEIAEAGLREVYALPLSKAERGERIGSLKGKCIEALGGQEEGPSEVEIGLAFKKVDSATFRRLVLDSGLRADGRSTKDIRPITARCGLLPRTHGSSLFTRGETQAICVATLGSSGAAQRYETIEAENGESARGFYLQYHFPPSSVGEVGKVGGPGRRELGHGTLAERALVPVVPAASKGFPYTVRVESTITESNGSSSMASVCGGCLAMMDAGVPVKEPVAGIAMGLILEPTGEFTVLSDILGSEDSLGDMDFKVAGGRSGITAFQMDIKVEGITLPIMAQALAQAKAGRAHILSCMEAANPKPSGSLSRFLSRIVLVPVDPTRIGVVIGPQGKNIKAIRADTGVEIQLNEDAMCFEIQGTDPEAIERARQAVLALAEEPKAGSVYQARKITSVTAFGVLVEYLPGKQGLVHVSELDHERGKSLGQWKEGDTIDVMLLELLDNGKVRLSRKATMPAPPPGAGGEGEPVGAGVGNGEGAPRREYRERGEYRPRQGGERREGGGGYERRGPPRDGPREPRAPREPRGE